MGASTNIRIPKDARIGDVANVIGILSGLPLKWGGWHQDGWVKVPGASTEGIVNIAACASIIIKASEERPLVDESMAHSVMFFFQPSSNECPSTCNLMAPPSTPYWIAVGLKLCKFFGGSVKYNDCESLKAERHFKRVRSNNAPTSGAAWHNFQEEISRIKPLTVKDLERARKVAGYKTGV